MKLNVVGRGGMDEDFRDPIACLFGGDFLVLSMALRQGLGVAHSGSSGYYHGGR